MRTEVSNPLWLKVGLLLGLCFFGTIGGYCAVAATLESTSAGRRIGLAIVGLFFIWLSVAGVKVIRFLNHVFEIDCGNAIVRKGSEKRSYLLANLRFRVSPMLQIVDVLDSSGRIIYSADFYATNAKQLIKQSTIPNPANSRQT